MLDSPAERLEALALGLAEDEVEFHRSRSLARLTSWRIGGPGDLFVAPNDRRSLSAALGRASATGVPVTFIGGGTNLLVSDKGVRGLVIKLGEGFDYIRWADEGGEKATVEVGAATKLARLVRETVDAGYGGLEFAAGIPGLVGGGTLMNAGAFGGELGEAIQSIEVADGEGQVSRIGTTELQFSYRKLALQADRVLISVGFVLLRSSTSRLRNTVEVVQKKRIKKQPVGHPNAGSVFRNPPGEYAGRLIERAGLKGTQVGEARISDEHANFIVNLGDARADDVRRLMQLVQDSVWERSGVWLEPEVRMLGEW